MNQKFEISLPNKLNKELELVTLEEGLSKTELVKKAVEDYLFVRKFRSIRKKLTAKAKEKGIKSDEDIFKEVS